MKEKKTQTMKRFAIVKDLWARIYFFSASKLNGFCEYGGGGVVRVKSLSHQSIFQGALLRIIKINNSIFSKNPFCIAK